MEKEVPIEMEDSFQKVIEVVEKCRGWEAVVRSGRKIAFQAIRRGLIALWIKGHIPLK